MDEKKKDISQEELEAAMRKLEETVERYVQVDKKLKAVAQAKKPQK